eukprot:5661376-Prymnesium_polylepis.2
MVGEIVTDEWVSKWKLEKKIAEWASDWGVAEVKTPTGADMCGALFKQSPHEWSPAAAGGGVAGHLPAGRRELQASQGSLCCQRVLQPAQPGRERTGRAEELNEAWPGLLQIAEVDSRADLSMCDHMLVYLTAGRLFPSCLPPKSERRNELACTCKPVPKRR